MRLAFEAWIVTRMSAGLDPDGRRVWGCSCIPVSLLSKDLLEQTLTGLLEIAMPIRGRIANGDFEIPDAPRHGHETDVGRTRV